MEVECGYLFRLLGKSRHGLQCLHEGVPLEPRKDIPSQADRIHDHKKPACETCFCRNGRYLLRKKAKTQGHADMGRFQRIEDLEKPVSSLLLRVTYV